MNPEQQRAVWEMLDRGYLAQVARQGPEPIFATVRLRLGAARSEGA
jgi:hypothetical protein